jgi:peptide/nickel transport system substrate-binding protein
MALTAAYDGLVGYRRQGGTGGTALVADLAESLPTPGAGGASYSFRVREGINYSDGSPVRAEDFRHAIERGFEVPGTADEAAAAVFYAGLVGADACIAEIGTEAECDLSDGIVADNATRSVTFHLAQPDPEFLYKLALPLAFVVPGDTPSEAAAAPIPATGPYMIADATETEIRLVRNPEFQVWSPEARPAGFPDEIVWRIDADDDAAIDRIIAGEADLLASRLPPARVEELATRYTSQIHVLPSGTLHAFLDTARPPFDDVRVREAINYAVDREHVVELLGGSLQATVTCQIIQPNFHGYRRVCPHTVDAGPAGLWTAPDIPRALALVEEANAAGVPVEIWAPDADPLPLIADYLATVMRELGFEASVTSLTFDEFFSGIGSDDGGPVAAPLVWFPDYPAASTFIQSNFACGSPINFAQFCNPALDERMQEAVDLQATDPGRAASIWAELDAAITEEAPWVPLATFNSTYFVSERVGNVQVHPQWSILVDQIWVE